jgi:general secretion pathway protein D
MNCLRTPALLVCLAAVALDPSASAFAQNKESDPTVPSQDLRELMTEPGQRDATPRGVVDITPMDSDPDRFAEARFVNVSLARIADELGRAADANVVVSQRVADQRMTITLRNVDLPGALKAIAIAQGLVARHDGESGVHFLATAEEVRGDLAAFRTTQTEVFTLLYPNASDVVRAIGDTFGERVIVTEDDQDDDRTFEELQNRFRRFDIVEGRSRGLSGASGGTSVRNFRDSQFDDNNRTGDTRRRIARPQDFRRDDLPELTAEEARLLAEAQAGAEDAAAEAQRLATRQAVTYVTAIQRLNRIIVRSGDPEVMQQIREMIKRLDVPTPLVLLEVRVLRVDLSDGLDSSFDFAFQAGDAQGAFSQETIVSPPNGTFLPGGVPLGVGVSASAGIFQVVSNNFAARLVLLQSKGRVTSLATPILLTANGEVSRIFSGEQVPITIGFTEPQVIVGDGATTTLSATPVTELRDVGTDLLITANINADRTVTLRLLQETSRVNEDGATILVPTGTSFTSQTVDTVQSQSASGTIVARDGLLLAFGGLIEETETDQREQLPVLGDLPLVGFLFRRESSVISRSELIVLVRPYVLSTPVEGDQISRNLLESLSIHPYRPGDGARTGSEDDWGVFRDEKPPFDRSIFDLFRYHTVPSFHPGTTGGGTP